MITTAKKNPELTARQEQQFVSMLPTIQRYAGRRFRSKLCEERDELIAEVVALSFSMFVRLVERGETNRAYASALANYACRQVASGRRLGTRLNVNDITSAYCRLRKGVRVQSLHYRDHKAGVWREVLIEDHRVTPADLAAARIDVPEFLGTLSERNRSIAEHLAAGESTTGVAKMFRVSLGRISQLRRELCEAWKQFHGERLQPAEVAA